MKKYKIMFWVPTVIIFLLEGVLPALTSQSPMAIEGIRHLGYPAYFSGMLAAFKLLGALVLIYPKANKNVREWAYAGFGIDFISAFISIAVVDGFGGSLILPIVAMVLLALSYIGYHKMRQA